MQVLDWKDKIKEHELEMVSNSLKNGELVIFPTETVYGIGADGLNRDAILKIFESKGRKNDNALILHVSSIEMVDRIAKNINDIELSLMNNFFPGPLTIIFDKKD